MEAINVKYRKWYEGFAPRSIKLQIPGWSGEQNQHVSGDKPQPWHCIPFVEASTYGLELLYAFNTECHVKLIDGKINFIGDFSNENENIPKNLLPPFSIFAPGHFGTTSCLDIEVPEGYIVRVEPHPCYYTDETNTVPLAIPGHLNTSMWPKIFFIVFKNPLPGQTLIFKKGDPIAQILILPRKISYDIMEMTQQEKERRNFTEESIEKCHKKFVTNDWFDYLGHNFDDKYKVLNNIFVKKGKKGVQEFLENVSEKIRLNSSSKVKRKLIIKKKGKNEII